MRLTLLAHAETRSQRTGAFPDSDDAIEGEPAAGRPVGIGEFGTILVSPARAARETAALLGLTAQIEPALRDMEYGGWRGLRMAEVEATAPAALAAWLRQPNARPPSGESLLDLEWRLAPWLDGCATSRTPILAITHAAVIRAAIVLAIGALPAVGYALDIAPLTRTVLSFHGRWRLQAVGLPLSDQGLFTKSPMVSATPTITTNART